LGSFEGKRPLERPRHRWKDSIYPLKPKRERESAAPAWGYEPQTMFNKLQVFQNKVLRIITKLPRVTPVGILHEQTGKETIRSRVRVLVKGKGKAVPLHAMEALGGRGGIAPTHPRPRY
jgi:hypothetical protein